MVVLALIAGACADDEPATIGPGGGDWILEAARAGADLTTVPGGPGAGVTDGGSGVDGDVPVIEWDEPDGAGFATGRMAVPVDHDDPDGATIELGLVRYAAGDPDRRIGSLLLNPGGPGGSGIELAYFAPFILGDAVLDRFDVIGFDPRGVGESTPVTCGDDAFLKEYLAADPIPDDAAEEAAVAELQAQFVAGCDRLSGDLLPHIGTEDVARDMDLIRAAVGDETLTYLGYSYGTLLGATYAELFPDRVRALVLDGAYTRSLTTAELTEGQAAGFEGVFDAFVAWCANRGCGFAREGDPATAFDRLMAQIDRTPLPTRLGDRELTVGLAWTGVIAALYTDTAWPQLDAALAAASLDGDGTGLLRLADLYNDRAPDGTYANSTFAFVAIGCADRTPVSPAEQAALEARLPEVAPRFAPLFLAGEDPCDGWPTPPTATLDPFRAAGAPPILVIATTGDPATPYAWGQRLAEELESGVLVTYQGDVHTVYGSGVGCVDDLVDAYLIDLEVPDEGVVCG